LSGPKISCTASGSVIVAPPPNVRAMERDHLNLRAVLRKA
jgi:hypothetical protein